METQKLMEVFNVMSSEQRKELFEKLNVKEKKVATANPEAIAKARKKSEDWFAEKLGVKVVQRGLKVVLPTSKGNKEYEAVKMDNGKTAIYTAWGSLRYAWKN